MRRWALVVAVVVLTTVAWAGAWRTFAFTSSIIGELERAGRLTSIAPRPQATLVFDRHGRPAFTFFVEQRTDVPLARVSGHMIDAILAVEDRRFFHHSGVDPIRIVGAALKNARAGRIVEGGSTITQQLARAAQLSPVRTYERKMREVLVAARLEERYSKAQILEEYLNTVYFGEGYYGVEAASRGYFGKSAADLHLAEAALLAALVRSPSYDAPCVSPTRALKRRNLVLALMRKQDRISAAELQSALAVRIPDASHKSNTTGALSAQATTGLYFQEEIRRQLFEMFGADRVLRGGLRVHSTYDPDMQREAERAIATRISEIARSRRAARDLQGSLVAMSPGNGDVYAIVGGRDFTASSFNRATQARRQAGSAFKPIIYAAALERGYAPGTLLRDLDVPISAAEGDWLPDGDHEQQEYTLRRALKVSSNRAAAQLLQQVGVTTTVYYAQRLGIESRLPLVPSLALGTGEVTLLELTAAYSAFANKGYVAAPRLITKVEDSSGAGVWYADERRVQALSATTAYLMSSMLSDVVSSGTAARARTAGFTLPAAGKTGTTDDYADAWFIGYTPHLLTGVWFGLDIPAPIMRDGFGGTVAVPAWARFMRAATKGTKPEWYRMPRDVEKVAICRISGERAGEGCRHATLMPAQYVPASEWTGTGTGEGSASQQPLAAAAGQASRAIDTTYPPALLPPVGALPPAEPTVYEDLFPVGSIPSETCRLHDASAMTSRTPMVDSVFGDRRAAPMTGPAVRTAVRPYVDRELRSDGTYRQVIRQRP
jgi:penicillin-binding protein 1A